jgi:predicted DCC family thiol-disulfide oxidoreductase YuxK
MELADHSMTDILLRNILGADFDQMPAAVRRMHSIDKTREVRGTSRVIGGKNPLSSLIRAMAALPRPTWRAPIHIRFVKDRDGEEWDRHFGTSRFHTMMKQEGRYLAEHLVASPITFVYEVKADNKGFSLHVRQVRFLGIPLPRLLRPTLAARAREWRGRYQFSTVVSFWFCGRVISYFGYLDAPGDAQVQQAPITIVYDGMCHLCSGSMAWMARRVAAEQVRFVPVQSEEGAAALKSAKLDALNPQSFLVIENGLAVQKTQAVIILLKTVGGKWKLIAQFLHLLPRMLTDKLYDWVAANRYKWFGRRESCFIP